MPSVLLLLACLVAGAWVSSEQNGVGIVPAEFTRGTKTARVDEVHLQAQNASDNGL